MLEAQGEVQAHTYI